MSFSATSQSKTICSKYELSKILPTIFIIVILGTSSSITSQKLESEVNEMKQGSKFHYKINTPTFWDIYVGRNLEAFER